MRAKPLSKYDLKDLHQEIDLFDRKIAYCRGHERFDSEKARSAALQKLVTTRETLVKAALDAVNNGVECDPKYLPRSFKQDVSTAEPASSAITPRQ
jgi:hypothetical protein